MMRLRGRSVFRGREEEFKAVYEDITVKVSEIAARYGVTDDTIYNTAKRLGLPPRMPILEKLQLPPFGKRGPRKAA
jgi:hypothetical protein